MNRSEAQSEVGFIAQNTRFSDYEREGTFCTPTPANDNPVEWARRTQNGLPNAQGWAVNLRRLESQRGKGGRAA